MFGRRLQGDEKGVQTLEFSRIHLLQGGFRVEGLEYYRGASGFGVQGLGTQIDM